MAKRFTDTALNRQPWFRKLKPKMKCAIRFLFDECDNAGVWIVDMETLSYFIGEDISLDELFEKVNSDKSDRIEMLGKDRIFIPGFIEFQYGKLSETCKPHKPIIQLLKKYNLLERVLKGYPKGIDTLEEKDKEKEKEIITEIEEDFKEKIEKDLKEEKSTPVPQMLDTYLKKFPDYPAQPLNDYPSLFDIFTKIASEKNSPKHSLKQTEYVLKRWGELIEFASCDKWYKTRSISDLSKEWQRFIQSFNSFNNGNAKSGQQSSDSKGQQRQQALVDFVNRRAGNC